LREFYSTDIIPELSFPLGVTAILEPSSEFKKGITGLLKSILINIYILNRVCIKLLELKCLFTNTLFISPVVLYIVAVEALALYNI